MARWYSCLMLIAILAAGGSIASSVEGSTENQAEISGNREDVDRTYVVTTFERVFVSGGATIELLQGTEFGMTARGSLDVLRDLTVESGDGSLFIDTGDHGAADLVIRLTFENLREIGCDGQVVITSDSLRVGHLVINGNGSSSIELLDLVADELQISGIGATKFRLSGQVERQIINIGGSGAYRAEHLSSRTVEVSVSGLGDVLLSVEEMLDVEIAGAARVRYTGSPFVTQRVFGIGSVGKVSDVQI